MATTDRPNLLLFRPDQLCSDDLGFSRGSAFPEDHKWFYAFYDGLIENEPFDLDEATGSSTARRSRGAYSCR
jgi:hypothetical protein